jgi:hypothetical protein
MPAYDPAMRTRTLTRIVGPYFIVAGVMFLVRQATLPTLLPAFMQDAPLVLATGAFTLMAGLALVASHHHWTGPSATVISLVGVAATLKGAGLMIAPDLGADMTAAVVRTPTVLLVAAGMELLVGLWLSYGGWLSEA